MHSCVCMGASIGMAHGIGTGAPSPRTTSRAKSVAVIGDTTFFHSGITPLMDIVYNRGHALTIILDNRTTGMTGGQENPGTGRTLWAAIVIVGVSPPSARRSASSAYACSIRTTWRDVEQASRRS